MLGCGLPSWPHLYLVISAKTLFSDKGTPWDIRLPGLLANIFRGVVRAPLHCYLPECFTLDVGSSSSTKYFQTVDCPLVVSKAAICWV